MLSTMRPVRRGSFGTGLRIGLGAIGVGVFAGGVVAVFRTNNGAGSAALVTVGALFGLVAALGDRVQALDLGNAKVSLRDVARERFVLAGEREAAGDTQAAAELRRQGLALQMLANEYGHTRRTMRSGRKRTKILDHIMIQLKELAQERHFEPGDVWEWFSRGQPETRVTAVGLMLGDESLRDVFIMLDAIRDSRSAFEQFYALRLAEEMLPQLSSLESEWLAETICEVQRRRKLRLGRDSDRWQVSVAILARLVERYPGLKAVISHES